MHTQNAKWWARCWCSQPQLRLCCWLLQPGQKRRPESLQLLIFSCSTLLTRDLRGLSTSSGVTIIFEAQTSAVDIWILYHLGIYRYLTYCFDKDEHGILINHQDSCQHVELLSSWLCSFYMEKRAIKWILIHSHGIIWFLSYTPTHMLLLLGI